jgi:TolB-like protein
MPGNSKNPLQFWQELKQRKVVRVITVYVAGAFAILQAADIIFSRLDFPSWTITLVMILLAAGFVISIILSWIYDITPEGVKKTKKLENVFTEVITDASTEQQPGKSMAPHPDEDLVAQENKLYAEKINRYKKKEKIYSLGSLGVILVVIVIFLFSSGSTLPFSKRGWILITDFENLTENPVFDKSLYTAFTLSISQSRYVNVFPRDRMRETLTRMEIKDLNYIDDKTGREIAVREGISICIIPSISKVGNRYAITAKILETKTGNFLRSEVLYAETQDEILAKLDHLSKKIRRNLGESRFKIAGQDKPLKKATTSSLEALKLYSLGRDHNLMSDFTGAKDYYENALLIDSGFTLARATL